MDIDLRQAVLTDRDQVSELMLRTFLDRDSDWMKWSHDADGYEGRLLRAFAMSFDFSISHGQVWVSTDRGRIIGGYMWQDSRKPITQIEDVARQFLIQDIQGSRYDDALEVGLRLVTHRLTNDFMYLVLAGTEPDYQGNGIGTEALMKVLEDCDRDSRIAFLEAESDEIPFYERLGFKVTGSESYGDEGRKVSVMERKPSVVSSRTF